MLQTVELTSLFNNKGVTFRNEIERGLLAFGGYSIPRELFGEEQRVLFDGRVPLQFALDGEFDNLEAEGQSVEVPPSAWSEVYVAGTCNNGSFFDDLLFLFQGEVVAREQIQFADFLADVPMRDEVLLRAFSYAHNKFKGTVDYLQPKIWVKRVLFAEPVRFDEMQLPDNPCMHIFAITLKEAGEEA